MPDAKISDLPAGGDPQDTDEFVVARGATNVSLAWSSLSNAATRNNVALTIGGNTAGAGALVSTGTLTLAGGNNITVSQAGNAITISGGGGAETQTAISGIANSQTTYTSGTVSLSELGAITIRSTTGNQFQFSVNAQSVQPETQTFVAGIQNSQTTYTSGTVNLSVVAGNLTIRSTTGQAFQFSASQTVQPETQTFIGGIAASNTTYTSGTVTITGVGGGITVSSNTGQRVDLSVAAQTVQTQGILSAGVSTGGNTAGNTTVNTGSRLVIVASGDLTASQATAAGASTITLSAGTQSVQTQDVLSVGVSTGGNTSGNTTVNTGSRFVIVGSNGITASQGTAAGATTVTLSGATQTAQTQGILNAGVSTGGNTSGDTTVNSGTRLVFVGSNNITLSQGTAANATTITISGPAAGGVFSGGMSTLGNTSGDTGYASQRLNLVGGNNITLSGSTDAGSMSITISAPTGTGGNSIGVSTMGNTAGSTGVTGTRMVLVGTGHLTLSQSTDANGGTVTIDPRQTLDFWDNMVPGASTSFQLSDAALNIYPLNPANAGFPGYMSVSTIFFDMSGTVSTAASFTRSLSIGFYTQVNSTRLSLSASASTSWGTNAANMNVNDSFGGRRWVTFHSSQFNNPPNFAVMSKYYFAVWHRSSSGSQSFSFMGAHLPYATGARSGFMSVASASNTTLGHYPFLGNYSVSFTTGMPNSLEASDINKSNATAISLPRIIFNNFETNII